MSHKTPDLFSKIQTELKGDEFGDRTLAALEAERRNGDINDIIEAEIFAKLLIDDRNQLGDDLAIKDIVDANIHARIVFKFTTNKIAESEMYAELNATRGKFTKHDVTEAEIFAKSISELEAERGKLTGKDIVEAKIFAKFFARALAKISEEENANTSAQEGLVFSVGKIDANKLPPSYGTVWLDGDEIWFTTPSVDFSFDGRSYQIPGGATCFPKEKVGREALLKMLRTQRDLWEADDEATLKARLVQWAEKLKN